MVKDAIGITEIFAMEESSRGHQRNPTVNFLAKFTKAALARGISVSKPSDSLDMSKDICLDEAAQQLGYTWEIHDEVLLCLTPVGMNFDWKKWIEDMYSEKMIKSRE